MDPDKNPPICVVHLNYSLHSNCQLIKKEKKNTILLICWCQPCKPYLAREIKSLAPESKPLILSVRCYGQV